LVAVLSDRRDHGRWPTARRKITFCRDARYGRARSVFYYADHRCSHFVAISADRWPDDRRLSDIEPRFICPACGKRGADVQPDSNRKKMPVRMMGYQ
jgi:hypothetical protein